MVNPVVSDTKLYIKADEKTIYSNSNIYDLATNDQIYAFAEAINSVQNVEFDKVVKTLVVKLLKV